MATLKQYGWTLEFASEDLHRDREIVMISVNEYGEALEYA